MSSTFLNKRGRDDGHLSRDDYDLLQDQPSKFMPATYNRADLKTIQSRRIVRTRQQEYFRHVYALNKGFKNIIQSQLKDNKHAEWIENMNEYLMYAQEIESKYGKKQGKVFTFGNGDCGQLAHGVEDDKDMIVKFPRAVNMLKHKLIIRIACGGLHSAAVTSLGEVYTWGCNDDGALGRTGEENFPAIVEGFETSPQIVQVVAGDCHTAALSAEGDIYTWGSYKDKDGKPWCDAPNSKESFKNKQLTPYYIKSLSNVVDLKCGDAFNWVRCSNGNVFSWGLGEMGQLGRPVTKTWKDNDGNYMVDQIYQDHFQPQPVLLNGKTLPSVKAIGCGSYHGLLSLAETGDLYTTGLNNYGQLGIGNTENTWELNFVEDLVNVNIVQVDGGTHHSVVLAMDGSIYAFGRGDSGQLGTVDNAKTGYFQDRPQLVRIGGNDTKENAVKIRMISVGSNHALALSENNTVYAWGYGEMLALGTGKEKDENRPQSLDWSKTSLGDANVLQVEAGGQHSAILAVAKDGNQLFG